jgi:hypothetical protein
MAFDVRITDNTSPKFSNEFRNRMYNGMMNEVHEIFTCHTPAFLIFIGSFMFEYRENLKREIVGNAQIRKFQGYKVAVLNFDSPSLTKVVGREMTTRFPDVDFAIIWAWHYSKGAYRAQFIDNHRQTKINMAELARKVSQLPDAGAKTSSGGHPHIGNLYYGGDFPKLIT